MSWHLAARSIHLSDPRNTRRALRRRPSALGLSLLIPLLALCVVPPARSGAADPRSFAKIYRELREAAPQSPFGLPLSIRSSEEGDRVAAEVRAILEHPFETVRASLDEGAALCEFLPLVETVKACTVQPMPPDPLLTLFIGRKHYQEPHEATAQPYRLALRTAEPGRMAIHLSAKKGLYGTTAHRFQLEASAVEGRTVIDLSTSYTQGAAAKLATAVYLATLGRHKIGFSREATGPDGPPQPVKGIRGMVERSVMRHHLALHAFLDTRPLPPPHRFETCLQTFYALLERYPLQLHDLEREEYLSAKRRERENSLRLQAGADPPRRPPAGPVAETTTAPRGFSAGPWGGP